MASPKYGGEYDYLINRVCITPYVETAGLMVVREVFYDGDEWKANGVFLGKHPSGYEDGSIARYRADDVRPTSLVMTENGIVQL